MVVKNDVTISGTPTFIALRGVQALDVKTRQLWEQKRSPQGSDWQVVVSPDDLDTTYVEEGDINKYVTAIQKIALNNSNNPSANNPFATLDDIHNLGLGNVWWVKAGEEITIEDTRENVISDLLLEGTLTIDGKLTFLSTLTGFNEALDNSLMLMGG